MHAELKRLREWKTDVEDSIKAAMDETCDANERHCTCVPLLRREVKRLQKAENYQLRGKLHDANKALQTVRSALSGALPRLHEVFDKVNEVTRAGKEVDDG